MKSVKYLAFMSLILLAMFLAIACGGGDDDDNDSSSDDDAGDDVADDDAGDDTAGDDSGDDDDVIDDDTVQNPLTVSEYEAGECSDEKGNPDPSTEPHDMVELEWQDGVLKVTHSAAILNCCFELQVNATQSSSTITVTETDVGDPCNCMCSVDVSYQIEGVTPGNYHFLLDGMNTGSKTGTILSQLDVTLDSDSNWKWGIPTVDLITMEDDPPYTAGTPMNTRVSACYLQDQENVQINYRVGGGSYPSEGIFFMVYDRRSLDNPVDPDPTCVLFYDDVTVDLAGTYYMMANSYLNIDPFGWSLYKQANAVVVN